MKAIFNNNSLQSDAESYRNYKQLRCYIETCNDRDGNKFCNLDIIDNDDILNSYSYWDENEAKEDIEILEKQLGFEIENI